MEQLFTAEAIIALVTLTALEIVLGIDNIVFISVFTGRLPPERRAGARRLGLAAAMISRLLLLLTLQWLLKLDTPLFHLPDNPILYDTVENQRARLGISGKDLILFAGGLFLLAKATLEIHHKTEGQESPSGASPDPVRLRKTAAYGAVITQIMLVDIVFSLDSVITAVGMVKQVWIMVTAVIIAVGVMLAFVNVISDFVERHPTIKMLALAFLVLIGVMLVAESLGRHIEKGYIYFAMAFSLGVEFLNLRARRRLSRGHEPPAPAAAAPGGDA
ncbi:MAG: TerC family protein [Phycisphaerales bacterium]